MEEDKKHIENHFEAGSNCQVFNGNISGCVFAMPGATVTQQVPTKADQPQTAASNDQHQDVVSRLKPMFFGDEAHASAFLASIQDMKPTQITDKVNHLVKAGEISPLSKNRDLWKVLHESGIYAKSESNWNQQIK